MARGGAVCRRRHIHDAHAPARAQLGRALQALAQESPSLHEPEALCGIQRRAARHARLDSDTALLHAPDLLLRQQYGSRCVRHTVRRTVHANTL